jgi:hypothetical protein
MSVGIVVSISIMMVLILVIWRLNRTKSITKNKTYSSQKVNSRKSALKINQLSQSIPAESQNEVEPKQGKFEIPDDFLAFKLICSESLDVKQQKIVSDIGQSFRKPHPLLLPLTQGIFEPNELFDLIKTDAEMTAKVLNAVNSPLFTLRQPITNINHAVIFLGLTQVKNIALQFAVQNNMEFTDKLQNKAYKKLWTASYLASAFCLLFAKEMAAENAAELSTHCLLSYLGDLAILSYQPSMSGYYLDDFSLYERTKTFQNTLGINAAVVGKYLAQQWQLPNSIEMGIDSSLLPLTGLSLGNASFTHASANKELSSEQLCDIILCYLSCRLGDLVAFGDRRDITQLAELSFDALGEIEFYYTQDNIKRAGFDKIKTVIADIHFRKKINKVIEQISAN